MQVGGITNPFSTVHTEKTGKPLPSVENHKPVEKVSFVDQLAQSIDPENMSRNDAKQIGDALWRAGDFELSSTFYAQSMVLNTTSEGQLTNASSEDAIMNENFSLLDSLQNQMAFNSQRGIPNDALEAATDFLNKMQIAKDTPRINVYA